MSHFNEVANTWDSPEKINMMKVLAKKTKEQLGMPGKLDILDFGCGTGLFGLEFYKKAKTLTGIDSSTGMLGVFQKKVVGLDNVMLIPMNLERDDIKQDFDLILSAMAFHHLEQPGLMIQKLKTMLRPKGRIAIVDLFTEDGSFHPDAQAMGVKHFGFSPSEIQGWATEAGLSVSIEPIAEQTKNNKSYAQFLALFQISP